MPSCGSTALSVAEAGPETSPLPAGRSTSKRWVVGSAGATDNAILRADGVGGATVQSSGITISDVDAVDGVASLDLDASGALTINGTNIISDSAGTATLSNIDALDATTEATIEAAIDTLANLTSIQSLTVTLADAGADAFFGWDDTAAAYENLTAAEAQAILGLATLSTDNAIVRFDGTGGGTQDSGVTIDDSDNVDGVASLTIDASGALDFGGVTIISDSAGTTTLSNIDAIDATTEATIEAAIDTLANLTSIQSLTVTLVDAGADAFFGWDDTASAYENLSKAEAQAILGLETTSTDNAIVRFDSTGGNTQNSGARS